MKRMKEIIRFILPIVIAVMLCNANAQDQNQNQGGFDFGSIFKKLLTPPAQQNADSGAPADLFEYLKLDAPRERISSVRSFHPKSGDRLDPEVSNDRSVSCRFEDSPTASMRLEYIELVRLLKTSDQYQINAAAELLTETAASCAMLYRNTATANELGNWSYFAGFGWLVRISSDNRGADPEVVRARAYLAYAKDNGRPAASDALAALDKKVSTVVAVGKNAQTATSFELVQQQIDNQYSFWRRNKNQLFIVTGPIRKIGGDDREAYVMLDGLPKSVPSSNRGFQHEVRCQITDPAQINKLDGLKVGRSGRFMGRITEGSIVSMQITLEGCSIL